MKVEYTHTPPQVFVSRVNRMVHESQLPALTVQLKWVRLEEDEPPSTDNETQQQGSTGSYMYKLSKNILKYMTL